MEFHPREIDQRSWSGPVAHRTFLGFYSGANLAEGQISDLVQSSREAEGPDLTGQTSQALRA